MIRLLPLALPLALVIGLLVRALPVLSDPFPLHDGGLFYVMAADLRDSGFLLPHYTSFNAANIPFAYPPLGLYILAAGSLVADPLQLLRVLPLIFATLTILGVYRVVALLIDRRHGAAAAVSFALMPSAFDWLIVGGGVTRGLGLCLALFTVAACISAARNPSLKATLIAGTLGGLTLLSHPESSLFAAVSVGTYVLLDCRSLRSLARLFPAALLALAISAPWWFLVMTRHGVDTVIGIAGSRDAHLDALLRLLNLRITGGPFPMLDVLLLLGMVGLLRQVGERRWEYVVWLLAIVLTTPGAGVVYVTVPWAALAAVGIVQVAVPILELRSRWASWAVPIAWCAVLINAVAVTHGVQGPIDRIPSSDQQTMQRLTGQGPVAVLTGRQWWDEGPGEWFPALANRPSAALAQGTEWLGAVQWRARVADHRELQRCTHSVSCLAEWMDAKKVSMVFVSAAVPDDSEVRHQLAEDPRYRLVHRLHSTLVFERIGP